MIGERQVVQSLEPGQIERLSVLLHEITDMHVSLGILSSSNERDGCVAAIKELHEQMDNRLVRALGIVGSGNEEG